MSVWGVRRPRAPAAQAHERGGFGDNSGSRCRDVVVPLALGNSQDLGSWRAAGCPSEVIRYASELLVVDVNLLYDAGIYACAKTTCEQRITRADRLLHPYLYSPIYNWIALIRAVAPSPVSKT
jgi:hypothetical protein